MSVYVCNNIKSAILFILNYTCDMLWPDNALYMTYYSAPLQLDLLSGDMCAAIIGIE